MVQKENLKPCQLKKYIINIIIPVQSLYLHVCVQFQQGSFLGCVLAQDLLNAKTLNSS